jgi:hypothetical protein
MEEGEVRERVGKIFFLQKRKHHEEEYVLRDQALQ